MKATIITKDDHDSDSVDSFKYIDINNISKTELIESYGSESNENRRTSQDENDEINQESYKHDNKKKEKNDKLLCMYCHRKYSRRNSARHRRSRICKTHQDATKIINDLVIKEGHKQITYKDMMKRAFTYPNGKVIYLNDKQVNFLESLK